MTHIDLTEAQFEKLLRLVYLGNWVINAPRPEEERLEDYELVMEHLFSYANKFGLSELVQHDETRAIPKPEFEENEEMRTFLSDYSDRSFWMELIGRLAELEAIRQHGVEGLSAMERVERFELLMGLQEGLREIFSTQGLEAIQVTPEASSN